MPEGFLPPLCTKSGATHLSGRIQTTVSNPPPMWQLKERCNKGRSQHYTYEYSTLQSVKYVNSAGFVRHTVKAQEDSI
jgi:hypothetical protein